jgi:hypothetical protein
MNKVPRYGVGIGGRSSRLSRSAHGGQGPHAPSATTSNDEAVQSTAPYVPERHGINSDAWMEFLIGTPTEDSPRHPRMLHGHMPDLQAAGFLDVLLRSDWSRCQRQFPARGAWGSFPKTSTKRIEVSGQTWKDAILRVV